MPPAGVARQQHFVLLAHQDNDARGQPGIVEQSAARAFLRSVDPVIAGLGTATPAESMRPMPVDDLLGATRKVEKRRINSLQPVPQPDGGETFRNRAVDNQRVAGSPLPASEIVLERHLDVEPAKLIPRHGPRNSSLTDTDDPFPGEGEIKRVIGFGTRRSRYERLECVRLNRPHRRLSPATKGGNYKPTLLPGQPASPGSPGLSPRVSRSGGIGYRRMHGAAHNLPQSSKGTSLGNTGRYPGSGARRRHRRPHLHFPTDHGAAQ